jgi:hypothetical protein
MSQMGVVAIVGLVGAINSVWRHFQQRVCSPERHRPIAQIAARSLFMPNVPKELEQIRKIQGVALQVDSNASRPLRHDADQLSGRRRVGVARVGRKDLVPSLGR